ncbi:hypothetical protein B0H10DRAFT_1787574, partial [Mycena sp. CBHHK59/15]
MTYDERGIFVARHPGPAAEYFDLVITHFIDVILKYNPKAKLNPDGTDPGVGLFGRCKGYYIMVEAQGRGTLHAHMVVWIEGNPSPQDLRDHMAEVDGQFKSTIFKWMESIISCELPDMVEVLLEKDGVAMDPPEPPADFVDPRLTKGPIRKDMDEAAFALAFKDTVKELAIACNWHQHCSTCWKHLKNGEARTDQTCRMRINGQTRALTELDAETESILLRRLHPRINNFNDLILFLVRCNMDIKYIGSGDAAKALAFYISDYITKPTLTTHIGLSAVEYAIKKNEEKFEAAGLAVPSEDVKHSLFTKTVMAMVSKQELSHQQVMSYLVGGGDCYTSHTFNPIMWGPMHRYVLTLEVEARENTSSTSEGTIAGGSETPKDIPLLSQSAEHTADETDDEGAEDAAVPEEVTLILNDDHLSIAHPTFYYPYRPVESEFQSLNLWQYYENVLKISKHREQDRLDREADR